MNPPPIDVELELSRHGDALRRLAGELLHDPAAADDAVQQVWLDALQRPPRHGAAFGGWLAAAVRNVAHGWRRRERRRARREEAVIAARPHAAEDHADGRAREELAQRLLAEVAALPQPYRDAIWQRFFEGKAPRDIAAARGVPVTTVKSWLKRALGTLRERLGERDGVDWRAGFAAAFGVGGEGTMVAGLAGGIVMATWAKVTSAVLAAAAGIAFVVWWTGEPQPSARTPRVGDGAAQVAGAASPGVALSAEREAAATAPEPPTVAPAAANVASAATAAPHGTIRGRAVDALTKEPLAGVRATLGTGKVDVDAPDPVLQTSGDGVFEFAVRAGSEPTVYLMREDRIETWCDSAMVPAEHVEQIGDVAMRSGRILRGRVVAVDGSAVPVDTYVRAEFQHEWDRRRRELHAAEARTIARGEFTLRSPVPFGPTTWKVTSDYLELRQPVRIEVTAAQPDEVVLVVQLRDSIQGIVVDEAGEPVAEIGIADWPTNFSFHRSGADGRFSLPRLRSAAGALATIHLAQTPGCEPHAPVANVAWGTADLRIVVKRTRPFVVEVVDAQGAPVEEFGVATYRVGSFGLEGGKTKQLGEHTGGRLAVDDVVRGGTMLRVMPGSPEWTPSDVLAVGTEEPLRVVLQRRVPLRVLVHSGGVAVPGVSIELLRERDGASASTGIAAEKHGDDAWFLGAAIEILNDSTTDAAGRATLLRDADQTTCVLRTRVGDEPAGIVRDVIAPPPGEELRIELPGHGRITGRVELRGRQRDLVGIAIPSLLRMRGRAIALGPDGTFDSGTLQAGTYRVALEVSVNGMPLVVDASARDVQVKAGAATRVTFDLADCVFASVRGTVVAAGPLPPGLFVDLRSHAGGNSELVASAEVAGDGSFRVAELLPGTFRLAFRRQGTNPLVTGLLPDPLVIAAGEEAQPRLDYAPRRLVVRLRRPDGSVVRDRVVARCGGAVWPEHQFLTPTADEQIVLDPAPLVPVELRSWNTQDAWSAPVVMPPDRAELEITVVLPGSR